jgi:pyruvate kinase
MKFNNSITNTTPRILVTLGPASFKSEIIKEIAEESIYLFRINLSHTPLGELKEKIIYIQQQTDVPICLDSEGAQIRNQYIAGGHAVLKEGDLIKIHYKEVLGDSNNISFYPEHIAEQLEIGDAISIDFNSVLIRVIEKNKDYCIASIESGGLIGSNKAVNVNRHIDLPSITDKDKKAINIAIDLGIRHYALSFANSKEVVRMLRGIVPEDSSIISKIESANGLRNLDGIINESDEIIIDRGDLSREISLSKIPFLQRRIVSAARSKSTPVYVATNLLESMVKSKLPTRAEINDVVSTLLMGADGLVLASETAIGKYPLGSVKMIKSLIDQFLKWTPDTSIEELLQSEAIITK